ncbi:hypothetical protein [Streptacidiphilus fuscans]|uniref:Uncharacterized protein n=1 Tax=Streptacidiphilus fuscans TaxID=2789292 RepID=A0A931FFW1_9ACTN|nr:hypothetical protein [Streptacidiphilus fuscans]MBF9070281.1 hypothetical protein [Streptacidiphilus fuscans]
MSGSELSALDLEFRGLRLLDSPWSVHFARGTRGRRALEVYNNGLLVDVMVESALAPRLLRGARRGERDGTRSVLAWGYLSPDGEAPQVRFTRGGRQATEVEAVTTAGRFWLALGAPCVADRVSATAPDGTRDVLRVRAGWSR